MSARNDKTSTLPWYESIDALLRTSEDPLIKEFYDRWFEWRARFDIYEGVGKSLPSYAKLSTWGQNKRMNHRGAKLLEAFTALQEHNKHHTNRLDEIRKAIRDVADIELGKLEIKQLRILEKAHDVKQLELNRLEAELLQKKYASRENIKNHTRVALSAMVDQESVSFQFFKKRENKWHLSRFVKRTDHASSVIEVGSSIGSLTSSILHYLSHIGSIITGAVSDINALLGSITYSYEAYQAWKKGKNLSTRIVITLAAATIIGGTIAAVFLSGAAYGIAAGVVAVMAMKEVIYPWFKLRRDIARKNREIKICEEKILKSRFFTTDDKDNENEKKLLLHNLEKTFLSDVAKNIISKTEFDAAKKLILTKGVTSAALDSNSLIKKLYEKSSLELYLKEKTNDKIKQLRVDIRELNSKENNKIAEGVAKVIGMAGWILLFFPLTHHVGAALLITSAVMMAVIKLDLVGKIKRKLFKTKTVEIPVESNTVETPAEKNKYKIANAGAIAKQLEHDEVKAPQILQEQHTAHHPVTNTELPAPTASPLYDKKSTLPTLKRKTIAVDANDAEDTEGRERSNTAHF